MIGMIGIVSSTSEPTGNASLGTDTNPVPFGVSTILAFAVVPVIVCSLIVRLLSIALDTLPIDAW